jgi:hypothetical protein
MIPGRLRVQYLMSKLMLRRQCPSRIRHQLVPSLYRATSPRIPENFLLQAQTVLLPNDGVLPSASIFIESSKEIFFAERYFVTKLGPQVSPFPVPIFGVNICPFNYGIKVILFRNLTYMLIVSEPNLFNTILPSCNPLESPLRSKP